jgi:hypothetical protein
VQTAAETYLRFEADGNATGESWELGFGGVPGICRVTRASVEDPDLKELLYIRGILNNRIEHFFNAGRAMQWLRAARSWGVPMHRLDSMARSVRNWTQLSEAIDELIEEFQSAGGGDNGPAVDREGVS